MNLKLTLAIAALFSSFAVEASASSSADGELHNSQVQRKSLDTLAVIAEMVKNGEFGKLSSNDIVEVHRVESFLNNPSFDDQDWLTNFYNNLELRSLRQTQSSVALSDSSTDNKDEFRALFEVSLLDRTEVREGEVVKGTIIEVREDNVLVDIGYKSEAIIALSEFRLVEGQFSISVGDSVDVFVEGQAAKVREASADESFQRALLASLLFDAVAMAEVQICTVYLSDVGPQQLKVIKTLKEVTDLSLSEASRLVRNAPTMLFYAMSPREAWLAYSGPSRERWS